MQAGDYATAFKELKPLAIVGDPVARANVGYMYMMGLGTPQDYVEAMNWSRAAADAGNAQAQHNVGMMYINGQGVPKDYGEAMKWFRKAAEQGYPTAQFNLGIGYEAGQGVAQDYAEAYKWLSLAASKEVGDQQKQALAARDELASKMTPQQIAEAQQKTRSISAPSSGLVTQAPSPQSLSAVRAIFVDSLGQSDSAIIRDKIINRLVASGKFQVVVDPDKADAMLVGSVEELERGTGFDATAVVRLITKDQRILWVAEAKNRIFFARSASSSLADRIVNDLLKALKKKP